MVRECCTIKFTTANDKHLVFARPFQHHPDHMMKRRIKMVVQYQLQSLWLSNLIKIDRIETLPAVAPRATAFITSVARLTPPSTKSWNFSLGKLKPRFSLR